MDPKDVTEEDALWVSVSFNGFPPGLPDSMKERRLVYHVVKFVVRLGAVFPLFPPSHHGFDQQAWLR